MRRRGRRAALALLAVAAGSAACGTDAVPAPPGHPDVRPYSRDSFWNTPVDPDPMIHPESARLVATLGDRLTSDPTQYTMAVYEAAPREESVPVHVRQHWSDVRAQDGPVVRERDVVVDLPLPDDVVPPRGSDGHVVVVDGSTGDEWGLWQAHREADGSWAATNGYHYDVDWSGIPPPGFGSRGSGVPYLAGLVRRAEVERGLVDHIIAFAYRTPSCGSVPPATKSDGKGVLDRDLPEGARLQLDPTLTRDDLEALGLDRTGRIIARALQVYGMVVVDVSGRPKVYLEAQHTALWPDGVDDQTVAGIPLSAFRVLDHTGRVSVHSCR